MSDISGHYQYGPALPGDATPATEGIDLLATTHRLRLDSLRLADGQYKARLNLDGQAPMALSLDLQGDVTTQIPDGPKVSLTARAQASGTLSGPDATVDVTAQAEGTPETPGAQPSQLALKARVKPWAQQPVVTAEASAQALNLAALWPSAPATDLSGQLNAQPDGEAWRASIQLDNQLVGPADKKGLPLQSLQAEVEQRGDQWTINNLMAQLGGGKVEGQGSFRLETQGETTAVRDWQGEPERPRHPPRPALERTRQRRAGHQPDRPRSTHQPLTRCGGGAGAHPALAPAAPRCRTHRFAIA